MKLCCLYLTQKIFCLLLEYLFKAHIVYIVAPDLQLLVLIFFSLFLQYLLQIFLSYANCSQGSSCKAVIFRLMVILSQILWLTHF